MNSQITSQITSQTPIQVNSGPILIDKEQLSETLYWMRGVLISLVVIGHVIGFDRDYGMRLHYSSDLSWLGFAGDVINTVHMPAFFIVSGLATDFFSRRAGSYGAFFTTKLPRLLLPLVCWAPPFFIFQSLAKNQPIDFESVLSSIYEPYQIFWFLHALIFAAAFRFVLRRLRCPKWLYFGISVVLLGMSLALGTFFIYWYWNFFFALGVLMSGPLPIVDRWFQRCSRPVYFGVMLLCAAMILTAKVLLPSLSQLVWVRLICGVPGFVLLYLLCGYSKRVTDRIALPLFHSGVVYLGIMSMVIYLFHGYFTRASSLILTKFLGQIEPIEYFLILSGMGIGAPLLLNAWVLKRNMVLAYITGGKSN